VKEDYHAFWVTPVIFAAEHSFNTPHHQNGVNVTIELAKRASVISTDWWKVLTASEERSMLIETQAYRADGQLRHVATAIGEHLRDIPNVLEPRRKFVAFLEMQCRFSKATAYRYVETYVKVRGNIPDLVLRTAIARGYDVIDMTLIVPLPPPNTQDHTKIVKYLGQIEGAGKLEHSNPQTLNRTLIETRDCARR